MNKADNAMCSIDGRLFYLSDDVNRETIGKICFNLLYILQEDEKGERKEKDFKREPIKLYINSYGGSMYDMWSLIDIILNSKTPIYTYCTGYAMSAAFMIFLAGHKRFASKNSTLLYHQMLATIRGTYMDIKENIEERDKDQAQVEKYVIERTKITQERLDEVREKKLDWYIYSEDFLSLGIVDKILCSI